MPETTWRTACGDRNELLTVTAQLEAKEWAQCIDQLKITLDIMYEICRIRQNVYGCEEALIYLKNAAIDFTSLIDTIRIERDWENAENIQKTLDAMNPSKSQKRKQGSDACLMDNDSNHSNIDHSANLRKSAGTDKAVNTKKSVSNCYANVTGGKITAPKSAMDLPQTKASMAKMAYSRLLLWQQRKKQLVEKLIARRRQQQSQSLAAAGRRRSLPTLVQGSRPCNNHSVCDRKPAANGANSGKGEMSNSQIGLSNLESINEAVVEDEGAEENSSTHTMAGEHVTSLNFISRSEPPCTLLDEWNIDVHEDEEWRAMTEEEESLAQEEESLKKEIEEEESLSVDDELQRFVEGEIADGIGRCVDEENDNCHPPSGWRPTWKEVVAKWKVKSDSFDSDTEAPHNVVTSAENKTGQKLQQQHQQEESQQHYRRPGELVQLRAKILSPSRKRPASDRSLDERQQKAEELRQRLLDEKADRLRILHQKIEEVNRKRGEIALRKREHCERVKERMMRAQENRQRNIEDIIRRAKEDEQRVMEISFINSLDAENVRQEKLEEYERDADRLQKRANELAEERARKIEQKIAKEQAAEERRRIAEEKRVEHLRQNLDRHQERLQLAEAQRNEQRNELSEKLRNRLRGKEQKIEERRINEQNLLNRILMKQEQSARRYEETLEQVRQKAGEMCSPRPPSACAILADFTHAPFDVDYEAPNDKICVRCNIKIHSDLQLMSHLISETHLRKVAVKQKAIDYDYFRLELERSIRENAREVDVTQNNEGKNNEACKSLDAIAKKRRAKLKTKLNKVADNAKRYDKALIAILHSENYTSNRENNKIHRKVGELLRNLRSADAAPLVIERGIFELVKIQAAASVTQKRQMAAYLQTERVPDALLAHCIARINLSVSSAPQSERLLAKSLTLIDGAIAADDACAASVLFASFSPMICELFADVTRLYHSSMSIHYLHANVLLFRTACLLLTHARQSENDVSAIAVVTLRSHLLLHYLCANGFTDFLELVNRRLRLKATSDIASPVILITKTRQRNAKEENTLTNTTTQPIRMYDDSWMRIDDSTQPENNVLNVICALGSRLVPSDITQKDVTESIVQAYASLFGVFLSNLYRHFCVLSHQESKRSVVHAGDNAAGTDLSGDTTMQRSFHSMASSTASTIPAPKLITEKYTPTTARCISACLTSLWNQACISNYATQLLQAMRRLETDECVTLRMSHCLRYIIQYNLQEADRDSNALLENAILAVGYFAANDDKMKLICALGWQRSLVSQLCVSLPLKYFSHPQLRHRLIPTIICVLYENQRAIDVVRGNFCLSWIIAYLKECNKVPLTVLPPLLKRLNLPDVIKFFENQQQ